MEGEGFNKSVMNNTLSYIIVLNRVDISKMTFSK